MPGFDGTGPAGRGPMTGGGRGYCSPYGPGYQDYRPYGAAPRAYGAPRPFFGPGRPRWGLGRGFARGRGRGGRRW